MAILHTTGTKLEIEAPVVPLNRSFLFSIGFVFIIAMHFFTQNPGGSGLALSFNPATWIGLSVTFAIGLYQLATNHQLRYSRLTIGLIISCILLTIPELYPDSNIDESITRLTGLWAGMLFFVLLQQFHFSNKQKQRILWFIVIAVAIESLFGYFQYLFLQPGNYFGYDTVVNRPYGIFQQPNVMASFLATGLALSGYLLARQPFKYQTKISTVTLLYVTPALTVPLLIVLASRTGWLGAAISIFILLPYLYYHSSVKRFAGWGSSIIVGILLGMLLAISFSGGVGEKNVLEKAKLDSPRFDIYAQTIDMFVEKPFTGYGYGKFEPSYLLYTARQHQLNPNYPPGTPSLSHPHNELLYWAVEGGLVPILGILLAASMILIRIYHGKKGTRLAVFALFVPIVLHTQLEYPFYHSSIHWIIFVILLFWVDQRTAIYQTLPFSEISKALLRIASLMLPIVTAFYMASALHSNYVLTKFEHTVPPNPEILSEVTNPVVWKDRLDWDIYSTYLKIGLVSKDAKFIQPYIDWSLKVIKRKPRAAFYINLIIAYQGLGEDRKAKEIQTEAEYLFPKQDFTKVKYLPPSAGVIPVKQHGPQVKNEGQAK
ncbi:PglL family O-oligosaccharyltransferase [Vibrio sp. S4M6]|uniref:PglL family O-oligosaccharyltransferase n=1 Tax=Vibrio sinus TaxID=2946865 RepID=UPI00202A09BF|nr:PglL family O-oligosaccharyltransferase [Vibrio sinus]MCL9780515.1 PglL family O-oligosaccharyltransferase [Vibrio sinus]